MRTKLIALGLVLGLVATATATPLYGVMFRCGGQTAGIPVNLFDVDPVTGQASNPRGVNVNDCVGIAVSPSGVMYGMTDQLGRINNQSGQGGKNLLFTINPTTGLATGIGRIDPNGVLQMYEGDLAFQPGAGTLWAVSTGVTSATLMTVSTTTGLGSVVSTILPPTGISNFDISAMAFDAVGNLWVLDTTYPTVQGPARLYRVDSATGSILQRYDTTTWLGNVAGMAFSPDNGDLLVADGDTSGTNNLYRFNFTTSNLDLIGATGATGGTSGTYHGLAGLAFLPEPGTLALLVIAGLVLRRR